MRTVGDFPNFRRTRRTNIHKVDYGEGGKFKWRTLYITCPFEILREWIWEGHTWMLGRAEWIDCSGSDHVSDDEEMDESENDVWGEKVNGILFEIEMQQVLK